MKIHTEAIQFKADQKLIDYIDRKLGKMEVFFDRVLSTRVVLKLENSGKIKGKVVEARLNVPGDYLIARAVSTTFEAAIDQVKDVLARQLIRYKDKNEKGS